MKVAATGAGTWLWSLVVHLHGTARARQCGWFLMVTMTAVTQHVITIESSVWRCWVMRGVEVGWGMVLGWSLVVLVP